jgi:Transposase IS116/IS110/IS902 family
LACKTDRVDARVLAVLSHRNLVPAIWLPDPRVRAEREQARFRLHLVKHKSMLKHRIHATLMTFGHPCPVTDLFGREGRKLLERLELPQPWRETLDASLYLIDYLESEIDAIERDLRATGADHRYVPLLLTVPGIGWVLAFTIASEIGDIDRFPSAKKLVGYTGLAHESASPARATAAAPYPSRGQGTCAGRCLKRPCTRSGTRLPRSLPRHQAAPGQTARRQSRPGRPRPQAHRSHLADAYHQPSFRPRRCGRRRKSSSRLTALLELRPRSRPPIPPGPPREGDREMSAASPTRSTKPPHRRSSSHSHSAGPFMARGRHPHADTTPPTSTRKKRPKPQTHLTPARPS